MNAAIAQHLNVAESAILEVQEWARVLWVRVRGIGARFVSKKVTKMRVEGIQFEDKGYGNVTDSNQFQQDWARLRELESVGLAHRVGSGLNYNVGGTTFLEREIEETNPETFVQTAVRWFSVTFKKSATKKRVTSDLVWDPREQSNDFDPDEM